MNNECSEKVWRDPAVEEAQTLLNNLQYAKGLILQNGKDELRKIEAKINTAELRLERIKNDTANHVSAYIFNDRLGVLEAILRIVPDSTSFPKLICDIRRSFAEAGLMLDIRGTPPLITPLEESLLQKEVVDNLLPRLYDKFPERAEELISCYHRVRTGEGLDSIFSEAFKTLEEIARSITGERKFEFKRDHLTKQFPLLHPTIYGTMERLRDHRGAEAAHGKTAPDLHEIRYLLFSICNVALLLLDYPKE